MAAPATPRAPDGGARPTPGRAASGVPGQLGHCFEHFVDGAIVDVTVRHHPHASPRSTGDSQAVLPQALGERVCAHAQTTDIETHDVALHRLEINRDTAMPCQSLCET